MSIIQQILNASDTKEFLSSMWDKASPEMIPAILLLWYGDENEIKNLAGAFLIRIINQSNYSATAIIIDPSKAENSSTELSECSSQTRVICKSPRGTEVTVKTITFALHMFVTMADTYEIPLLNDALDAFIQLAEKPQFSYSSRMMLDAANFALLFFDKEDPVKQKARGFMNKILKIAESNSDPEVLLTIYSLNELFPEEE